MTIANILLGSFLVIAPVALVVAHRTGLLSDWWYAAQRSRRRIRRL